MESNTEQQHPHTHKHKELNNGSSVSEESNAEHAAVPFNSACVYAFDAHHIWRRSTRRRIYKTTRTCFGFFFTAFQRIAPENKEDFQGTR